MWTPAPVKTHHAMNRRASRRSRLIVSVLCRASHLRDQAFIESLPDRGFRVSDFVGLLQAWRQAYRFDRHVRRAYFTLLSAKAAQEKLRSLDSQGSGRLAYAAFSAADVQAPTVRQPTSGRSNWPRSIEAVALTRARCTPGARTNLCRSY
jgi:hypothetical protein